MTYYIRYIKRCNFVKTIYDRIKRVKIKVNVFCGNLLCKNDFRSWKNTTGCNASMMLISI